MWIVLATLAMGGTAGPAPGEAAARGPAVGVAITGEALRDASIAAVYGDASLGAEARASAPLPWLGLEGGVQVGYRRLGGSQVTADGAAGDETTWLWYAPIALTVGGAYDVGAVALAASAGPAYTLWAEQAGDVEGVGYMGGKWGVLAQGEVRLPLSAPTPDLFDPSRTRPGLELVGTAGWRWSFRRTGDACGGVSPCGLDFSALRLGVGAMARF